jgi:hypothetical protein
MLEKYSTNNQAQLLMEIYRKEAMKILYCLIFLCFSFNSNSTVKIQIDNNLQLVFEKYLYSYNGMLGKSRTYILMDNTKKSTLLVTISNINPLSKKEIDKFIAEYSKDGSHRVISIKGNNFYSFGNQLTHIYYSNTGALIQIRNEEKISGKFYISGNKNDI